MKNTDIINLDFLHDILIRRDFGRKMISWIYQIAHGD
jgi:hypothetical protein